jgi:hypothetical protein
MMTPGSSSVGAGHSASKDARKRALVPAIHVLIILPKAWMPGTRPGMTTEFAAP